MKARKQYQYKKIQTGNWISGFGVATQKQQIIKTKGVGTIKIGKPETIKYKSPYRKRLFKMSATTSEGGAYNRNTGWKKRFRRSLGSSKLTFYSPIFN